MTSTTTSTATAVNTKYSSIATNNTSADYSSRVAASFGYKPSQLADLPPNTNLGLSCGNPLATANVQPDDVVVDLGSGGGLDCLIAANSMVKAAKQSDKALTGKVYGVDASEDMITLATKNTQKSNLPSRAMSDNKDLVTYVQSSISSIPLSTSSATLIISNCVINLLDHELKPDAFKEIHRLLQPGGRVAISDILTKKPLPESMRKNVALVVGCVSGAASKEEYETWMVEAGFDRSKIIVRATGKDLNVYKDLDAADVDGVGCCGAAEVKTKPESNGCGGGKKDEKVKQGGCCGPRSETAAKEEKLFEEDVSGIDFNEWVGAYEIYAVK